MSPTYSVCSEDGYLDGEQFTCPHCNGPAEVYSRITGYYRPVQNWNDGKAQEYDNRKTYEVEKSREMPLKGINIGEQSTDERESSLADGLYLFTTKTCPNCKIAMKILDDLDYSVVDGSENIELTREHGIMQAPTLVVVEEGNYRKYTNVSKIKSFVDEQLLAL